MKVLGHKIDDRPPSMLEPREMSRGMLVGGVLAAIGAHIAVPLAVMLVTSILAATLADAGPPQSYIEERIVEARFVRKGIKKEPNKLPDRIVPKKSTAPDDSTVVSKNMNPEPPEKKKEEKPEQSEEDLLTRFGDIHKFAEIAEQEQEGDPEGIEGGTETEAQAGNIYAGQLAVFFRRGWTIPNTITDASKLAVVFDVEITRDGRIGDFKLLKTSGVPLFDQSGEDRLQYLRSNGMTVPDPPPEVAHQFLGRMIPVQFDGKSAGR